MNSMNSIRNFYRLTFLCREDRLARIGKGLGAGDAVGGPGYDRGILLRAAKMWRS
jgi:hypothetical protein